MIRATWTHEMQAINHELAEILGTDPADLTLGADAALADDLVICGILGGKDVGKSTLINALACTRVSVDAREVGRGTEQPMVYVHRERRQAVDERLRVLGRQVPFEVTLHDADPIRNVVLVDLPDFDSEFRDHLQVVQVVTPMLDRVLWVQTPRKIGDRALMEMFQEVVKDVTNVHCVLNKVDELLADGDLTGGDGKASRERNGSAEAFWRSQHEWVARMSQEVGFAHPDEHRFLVAAALSDPEEFVSHVGHRWGDADWSRYADDRDTVVGIARLAREDLDKLRDCVLSPVSLDQARSLKEANRLREQAFNTERIRRYYQLEGTLQQLSLACDVTYHQQIFTEALGAEFGAVTSQRLTARLRPANALADELLERRVERWPLLRLVYWPFGWFSRALGRRLGVTTSAAPKPVEDLFDIEGRRLQERVELVRTRILADFAVLSKQLKVHKSLPGAEVLTRRATLATKQLIPQCEARLLESLCQGDRSPGWIGRAMLWLILLWFPFLQPILEGGLGLYVASGTWDWAQGLYHVVTAFSATHLLVGFAVVALVYVAILAAMYARCLRAVQGIIAGTQEDGPVMFLAESIDEALVSDVLVPLIKPFQQRLERLASLAARLDRITN